jgi:hypothetical protein
LRCFAHQTNNRELSAGNILVSQKARMNRQSQSLPRQHKRRRSPTDEVIDREIDELADTVQRRFRRLKVNDDYWRDFTHIAQTDDGVQLRVQGAAEQGVESGVKAPRSVRKRCRVETSDEEDMDYFLERVSSMQVSGTSVSSASTKKRIRTSHVRSLTPPPMKLSASAFGEKPRRASFSSVSEGIREFEQQFLGSREPIPELRAVVPGFDENSALPSTNLSLRQLHEERLLRLRCKDYDGPKLSVAEPKPSARPFFE